MAQYQGIWSLQQQAQSQSLQQWVTDPYFKNTTLLLQGDNATNGSNNFSFLDSSTNGSSITRVGNVAQGSFSPFSPGSSIYFPGTGNYLSPAAGNEVYNPGATGAWTFETWVYLTSTTSGSFYAVGNGASFGNSMDCGYNGTTFTFKQSNGTSTPVSITASTNYPINNWYHYAVSKDSSNVIRMFINGVQVGTQTYSLTVGSSNRPVINGVYDNNGLGNNGCRCYLSNLRWVKGGSLYTSNFIPSTLPLSAAVSSGVTYLLFAQSNRFVDNSQVNNTFVATGNTFIQSFSPLTNSFTSIPPTYSNWFDGANAYANISSTSSVANMQLLSANFTIESWIYPRTLGTEKAILSKWSNTTGDRSWVLELDSSNQPTFLYSTDGSGTITLTGTTAVVGNAWTHVAVTRSGNTANIYVNGTLAGQNTSFSPNIFVAPSSNVNIGRYMNAEANVAVWNGLISNARIVKGTAVYTANFTPAASPLTAVANTTLLVCQGNAISVDNGPSKFNISQQGNVRVSSSVIPFDISYQDNPNYQTATVGGSAYFNGTSNNYLLAPSSPFTRSCALEFWLYPTSLASNSTPVYTYFSTGTETNGLKIQVSTTGNVTATLTRTTLGDIVNNQPIGTVVLNQWNHIAIVTGSLLSGLFNNYGYVNGVQSPLLSTATLSVGSFGTGYRLGGNATTQLYTGYIAGFRQIDTSPYSSSFDPPSAPPIATSTTNLLLNFTNASIYDATMKNNLETVSSAQISTSIYKFGSGSMYFNGTGDYLNFANSQTAVFNTGSFTIEGWFYFTVNPKQVQYIIDTRSSNTAVPGIAVGTTTTGSLFVSVNNTNLFTTSPIILDPNKFYHIAVVSNGTTITLFLNGENVGSGTNGVSLTEQNLRIGAVSGTAASFFNGYMDEFRITKGVARYTSPFIPPKQALPRQ